MIRAYLTAKPLFYPDFSTGDIFIDSSPSKSIPFLSKAGSRTPVNKERTVPIRQYGTNSSWIDVAEEKGINYTRNAFFKLILS